MGFNSGFEGLMDHSDNFILVIRSDVGKPAFLTHWSTCVTQKFLG